MEHNSESDYLELNGLHVDTKARVIRYNLYLSFGVE